ncbi:MAG: metallophosphoesterase [Clostridia bacterium]|nr:metallophosphoesterase [Clostridia bacterium]
MAKREKQKSKSGRKPSKRRSRLLPALLIALVLVGGCLGWMHMQARVTHLRRAELYLPDLPSGMDGATLLFVSDLNIRNGSDARACARLMDKLAQTGPDMLVLGGDYSAPGLLDIINGSEGDAQDEAAEFIESLADFPAPLGKFAVAGENDTGNAGLEAAFAAAGIDFLDDEPAAIRRNGSEIVIAGLSDDSLNKTPYTQTGRYFSRDDCVIAVAHNPASYIDIRVNEARDGGAWADLVLSGHTLGGQIKLLGRTLRSYPPEVARCLGGWYYIDDLLMLVSEGVGCEGPMLRLGTRSEAWLLTLRRQTVRDAVPETLLKALP